MPYREFHYRWEYLLKSSPEKLWPFVADTNRFNRDAGLPSLDAAEGKRAANKRSRRLRLKVFGVPIEWEESPFEWVRPKRVGVTRDYLKGPVAKLVVLVELEPLAQGGSKVIYQVWARPKSFPGLLVIPIQIGLISARRFARAFAEYDRSVAAGETAAYQAELPQLGETEQRRLESIAEKLIEKEVDPGLAAKLVSFVSQADDIDLSRIRPYTLADEWHESRRAVLEACFQATRIGLFDLQWDLLCPMCRGPQETTGSLRDLHSKVHCGGCQIDFSVNFDRFVEVTFRPNATIRNVDPKTYCVGSPSRTPHVVAQQMIPAHGEKVVPLPLEPGRYRVRASGIPSEQMLVVNEDGPREATVTATAAGWGCEEVSTATYCSLRFQNQTDSEQLFVLERMAWSDQAATAAEVTALQIFRDLFSTEALRAGEQISVGTLTVLFTDLRNSTQLYREIGDATAFGRVLNHFDVLKQAIADEDGAVVKTIGDAVMAVFRRPAAALRAMLRAQRELASPQDGREPLTLKAGMHAGPCIAVTLNERLDYFGSTVNLAARLEGLSTGTDVIISPTVFEDPEVRALIEGQDHGFEIERFASPLKGFDERFELLRVRARPDTVATAASD